MNQEDPKEAILQSILQRSYEIEAPTGEIQQDLPPMFYLVDEEDRDIIMHREVHFGGNFSLMLDAYRDNTPAAVLDADYDRIVSLEHQEEALQQNIAPLLLSGPDAEKIAAAKKMYAELRTVFEGPSDSLAKAIADLIIGEDDPEKLISTVVSYGRKAIPFLLDIINSHVLTDPLFPGYGKAPLLAIKAIGELRDVDAIEPLFSLLGKIDFEYDEAIIEALQHIGPLARLFLIERLKDEPVTITNEHAAIGLLEWKNDPEIVKLFFQELQKRLSNSTLALYLCLGCETLPQSERAAFKKLIDNPTISPTLAEEMQYLVNCWDKKKQK